MLRSARSIVGDGYSRPSDDSSGTVFNGTGNCTGVELGEE